MHAKDNIKLNHTAKDTDRKSTGPFKSYDKSDKLPFNSIPTTPNRFEPLRNIDDQQNQKKRVLLLGNSHLNHIAPDKISGKLFVEKHIVYTIDQALALLSSIESDSYDCVYMHLFTNDVRNSSVEDCIYALDFLVGKINEVWPSCKIVISAGLPRSDSTELNDKIYECNIRLLNKYLGTDVQICDNSCF